MDDRLFGLGQFEQRDAEPDVQFVILGPSRENLAEAVGGLGVLATTLCHHAQQPDRIQTIRRQREQTVERSFGGIELPLFPFPARPGKEARGHRG